MFGRVFCAVGVFSSVVAQRYSLTFSPQNLIISEIVFVCVFPFWPLTVGPCKCLGVQLKTFSEIFTLVCLGGHPVLEYSYTVLIYLFENCSIVKYKTFKT